MQLQANSQVGHLTSARRAQDPVLSINKENYNVIAPNLNPQNFMKFTADNIGNSDSSLDEHLPRNIGSCSEKRPK